MAQYQANNIEKEILDNWLIEKPFSITIDPQKESMAILMPPPNITGILHLGHVLNNTLQDVLIRYYRKKGKNTAWFPGIDHASIATEAKVIDYLKTKGLKKSDLSEDEFLKYCWEWKEKYGNIIIDQLKRIGLSFDYDRITFTMDKKYSDLVIQIYNQLKSEGYVYKGTKTLPFDPIANTFLSTIETYEKNGKFYSERTDSEVQYLETTQIFLKMDELSQAGLREVIQGNINLYPKNQIKSYKHWFDNMEDWCISRNLTWGQKIPDEEGMVFDTWFSSWLWSIGCFKNQEEKEHFSPTYAIITGEDIQFFWIARMIMAHDYLEKNIPFKNVYFTGILRDEFGRKFSKQLNNSPDILKIIDEYGADSLRFAVLFEHTMGNDQKWSMSKVTLGKKFCNKIWNINNLLQNYLKPSDNIEINKQPIIEFVNKLTPLQKQYDLFLENFRFSEALQLVFNFIWEDFASQLLEQTKPNKEEYPYINKETYEALKNYFSLLLSMLEPFMPFITTYLLKQNEN